MEKRYSALRTVASIMKGLGIIVGIITGILVIIICLASVAGGAAFDSFSREFGQSSGALGSLSGALLGIIVSLIPIILGGSLALTLYAIGEAVNVQIDIEENTRSMVFMLRGSQPIQAAGPVSIPQTQAQGELSSYAESKPIRQFCPNCGTKISETDEICPNCEFDLR